MGDATLYNVIDNNTVKESATETWNQDIKGNLLPISKRIPLAGLTKFNVHPNQIITVLPISFGTADAILISE